MGDLIEFKNDENGVETIRVNTDLVDISEQILFDTRADITSQNTISMPIAQLSTLGAGVASLIPALHTITQTTTVDTQGLYQLANANVGDVLKVAKNGNFWGAFKTAEGGSKFAQLKAADPLSYTNKLKMPINPATMMMAVALFSIEQQLGSITEMEKQIISFLEIEKESEIEADVEILSNIITKYKHNWDNNHFVSSNHKLVLDIQRTAKKNMLSYQKTVADLLNSKKRILAQAKVNSTLQNMLKKFQYYRLTLFIYAMASFIEIMLSGNFKEENIIGIITEIEKQAFDYRDLFKKGSMYLEKKIKSSIEANLLKGIGRASEAVGKAIGNVPVVNKGPVDEFLQDGGSQLRKNANDIERAIVSSFATISNPGTGVFLDKMRTMVQIYNHTAEICFDDKQIYLITA